MSYSLEYKQVVELHKVTCSRMNTDWRVDIKCPTLTTITIVFYKASLGMKQSITMLHVHPSHYNTIPQLPTEILHMTQYLL